MILAVVAAGKKKLIAKSYPSNLMIICDIRSNGKTALVVVAGIGIVLVLGIATTCCCKSKNEHPQRQSQITSNAGVERSSLLLQSTQLPLPSTTQIPLQPAASAPPLEPKLSVDEDPPPPYPGPPEYARI